MLKVFQKINYILTILSEKIMYTNNINLFLKEN
jgi:hypothetical protein